MHIHITSNYNKLQAGPGGLIHNTEYNKRRCANNQNKIKLKNNSNLTNKLHINTKSDAKY